MQSAQMVKQEFLFQVYAIKLPALLWEGTGMHGVGSENLLSSHLVHVWALSLALSQAVISNTVCPDT